MPYLPTAQAWLTQSALLLQARPTTTRITTKYTLTPPSSKSKSRASKPGKSDLAPSTTTTYVLGEPSATAVPPSTTRATLTLKTYDPKSGATLKYQTDKAAEVGRLISALSRLGRGMAGLPELKDDVTMLDAVTTDTVEVPSGVATPVGGEAGVKVGQGAGSGQVGGGQVGGGQGGKKGKKKGKK